jgi:1-acyl-sn-glycerol-3-phosphate acyltransferase
MVKPPAGPVPAVDEPATGDAARARADLDGALVLRPRRGGREVRHAELDLRTRLLRLHAATEAELERRRSAAELVPADALPVPVRELSSIGRELPRLATEAPRAASAALSSALRPQTLLSAVRALAHFAARQRELASRTSHGEQVYDDFGFDREWTDSLMPIFKWLYHDYWRVRTVGIENVPASGRAMLISNHAGVIPYDGAMIRTALILEHPAPRHGRALILNQLFAMPIASWFLRRTGNTLAHPGDAERLLERDELVLIFPEGAKGAGKLYRDRYRLRRFGRGGFVQIALRTRSPIVPVSVVGSEELHPMIIDVVPAANALGLPYFPITATFPWLGPLGALPLPSSWIIEFHPPVHLDYPPEAADDASLVMQISDQVRDIVQAGLYRNLERRGSVFAH